MLEVPLQSATFDAILESITNNQGHLFFIHAAGGCGKTFLCNTIATEVRRRGQVALCVWHHLGLLFFCWMEEEHLTYASRFLFPFMKTLWLDSNAIVTCSQSSNKPRLSFGMKFLCSTSIILMLLINVFITNFIWPYLYQLFNNSHGLNGYKKPSKRPFDRCQSCLEAINIGQDIKQINW